MVYIQLEHRALLALCYWSAGTDLVVLTFQLLFIRRRNSPFFSFLFSFFYFFSLSVSIVFFETYFSLLSPVSLTLPLPPFAPRLSAPDKTERPFVLLQTIRSTIPRSWLTQKVRAFLWYESLCTDWRFSVMETLAVILNCRWQGKRLNVPFNSVWKENIVFFAKK